MSLSKFEFIVPKRSLYKFQGYSLVFLSIFTNDDYELKF